MMGYTIKIGELDIIKSPDDGIDCPCISFTAKEEWRDDAPSFGEVTDFTNSRLPSCTAWREFSKAVGLYDIFYDATGKIGGQSVVRLVTSDLVKIVGQKKKDFELKYPDVKPEFTGRYIDCIYCRLIWLDYWLNWAFKNCKTPVIATF